MVDFPAGVVRWTGMMIFLGATTVLARGLIGLEAWSLVVVSLPVERANRAPEQAAESSSSRWVRLSDLLLVVLELRLLATDDRLVVRRVPPNMEAGLPPPRILRGAEECPLPLLVVLQPDSLSTPSSSGLLECWIGRLVEVWCGLVPFWNWAAPRAAALSRLRSKPRPESLELSQLLTLADDDEDEDVDDPTSRCCCCCCCCKLNC
uniref:(northern house mosquito) hypothetical protein n=1 Tax=Culex pipiens TaxID=7175 RepID=A0A8D8EVK0_CULPI